jgi:hypothetical protein
MFLGIYLPSGHVYEGTDQPSFPVVPAPVLTPAKLISTQTDWNALPAGLAHPMPWMFREDTYDPVTRTRRGRIYLPIGGANPSSRPVVPHPHESHHSRYSPKELWVYSPCLPLLSQPHQGVGATIALGTSQAASAWRIIQIEVLATQCIMITLKSLSAFAILPDIDQAKIPQEFKQSVAQELDRVLNSAFRETPISVIDHCRDAMTVVLSRWLVDQRHGRDILGKDLGDVAATIAKPPYKKESVSRLALVIARLHSRGKTNEAFSRGLRVPINEDAELALQILGFALRDLGWAT